MSARDPVPSSPTRRAARPAYVRTGLRISGLDDEFKRLHAAARAACPDEFIAEETRELHAAYGAVSLGLIDRLRTQLAQALALPEAVFSRDRFSMHGCGPVGLHDDFFRFPHVYFVIVVVHSGELGLVDAHERAHRHQPGEVLLLDPRAKHALVPEGSTAEEHPYDSAHRPQHEPARQFMFLDFDLRRPDLRAHFRRAQATTSSPVAPTAME